MDSLANLAQELSFIWPKCTETKFEIGTEQAGKYITVKNITAQQTMEICKADNYNQRIRMANDMAMINNVMAPDVLQKYFAQQDADSDLLVPDKPVLTSTEKAEQPKSDSSSGKATLTILVIGK